MTPPRSLTTAANGPERAFPPPQLRISSRTSRSREANAVFSRGSLRFGDACARPGLSGLIRLRTADRARTPRTAPTPRRDDSPPSRTSEQPSAQSAARLKSLTPLYKQRQQRRLTVLIVIIIALALALTVVTGTLSASLALLGDAVDSASLYLNRADGGWPVSPSLCKSNRWRTASSSWAMRMCSSTRPTAPKF